MFRGKNKIDLPDRIYDNPLQHFPLLNTVSGVEEAHYEPLPIVTLDGVDTPHASMIREVGLSEEVVPMSEPSKVQKLVQHLENQSNMQVSSFKPEIQQISISKDIVPFSYVEVVRRNVEDDSKEMVLHVENVPILYKFSVSNSIVEAVGNSKNRVYKDTRNSNMEKRITRAVSSAQKERSDLLKDKRLLPSSL